MEIKNMTAKIEVQKKEDKWIRTLNAALNGSLDVSYYSKDGEIYINTKDEEQNSIVIRKDGSWDLQ